MRPAKYKYCKYRHARPPYVEGCQQCTNVTRATTVTESAPTNVTSVSEVTKSSPATNVTGRGFGTGSGRAKVHKTNADRQAAYRERKRDD